MTRTRLIAFRPMTAPAGRSAVAWAQMGAGVTQNLDPRGGS